MKKAYRPSSLRHLILLGFFVSLIPLCLLIWQSNSIQKKVSASSIQFTNLSISSVRVAVEMDNLLVDIERGIRQFVILQSESLVDLANINLENYLSLLDEFCAIHPVSDVEFCKPQKAEVSSLLLSFTAIDPTSIDTLFSTLRARQNTMMENLWLYLELSTKQQKIYADEQQVRVNRWLVGIALVTFVLVVLISGRVAAPVKQLEEKINAIGSRQQTDSVGDDFSGPYELRNIFEKLQWLEARLVQLEALRQSFLRHASHEFKTPLSSIKEGCSILSEELAGPVTKSQKEVISLLDESALRLGHLTEQLLDYNYFLQQQEPNLSDINADRLFKELQRNHLLAFTNREQVLTSECTVQKIRTDRILFTRIIENLLSNAQAYGGQRGKVLIQLSQQGEFLTLRVANTGPKISANDLEHLLEPFYRADVPRYDSLRGSGLGLSIVNDCARLLGGQVELMADDDYDFIAKVTLPVY
jgi:two-component system sensor histidine kinase GlrK